MASESLGVASLSIPAPHRTCWLARAQCHVDGAGARLSDRSDATKSYVWPDIGLLLIWLGVGALTAAQQSTPEVPGTKPINRIHGPDLLVSPMAGVPALWGLYGLTVAKRSTLSRQTN